MKKKSVAIFSTNIQFLRFLEIESISCGFEVNKYEMFLEGTDNFDLIVIDSDTVSDYPETFSCPVCIASASTNDEEIKLNDEYSDCYILRWPTSIALFRKILQTVSIANKANTSDEENTKFNVTNVIYYSPKNIGMIWYRNRKIQLSDLEMKLLVCLCEAQGKSVDRKSINELFDTGRGNIAEVYIHHLRKKLEEPFSRKLIFTERSKGYRINAVLKRI